MLRWEKMLFTFTHPHSGSSFALPYLQHILPLSTLSQRCKHVRSIRLCCHCSLQPKCIATCNTFWRTLCRRIFTPAVLYNWIWRASHLDVFRLVLVLVLRDRQIRFTALCSDLALHEYRLVGGRSRYASFARGIQQSTIAGTDAKIEAVEKVSH